MKWCTLIFLASALGLHNSALADFKSDYSEGLKALRAGDPESALGSLRSAIEENPNAATRIRLYGMRFDRYLPHYFLGVAHFALGDCRQALDAWDEASQQGIIQGQSEYQDLKRDQKHCSVASFKQLEGAARRQLSNLREAFEKLQQIAPAQVSGIQNSLERLGTELQRAIEHQTVEGMSNWQTKARALSSTIADLHAVASDQLEQERIKRNRARADLLRTIAVARQRLREGDEFSDPVEQALKASLAGLVSSAERLDSSAPSARITALHTDIDRMQRQLIVRRQSLEIERRRSQAIPTTRPPPTWLLTMAEQYLSGDYEGVLRLDAPIADAEPGAQTHGHLFRASALFNLSTLSGEKNSALLEQAKAELQQLQQIDPEFQPDLSVFPPDLISLLLSMKGR
ncbi:MAG: hypothetical protein DHS20C11_22870 [Lysobacteraceae bacterium]|nr:MAG: hypothetical protein DHS20C11_22870 [Xanthomonadaceae bacterium]